MSETTLIINVHVFDGVSEPRIENASVLVEGNLIKMVSPEKISAEGAALIDGSGRTLMPGLSDAHWHVLYEGLNSLDQLRTMELYYIHAVMPKDISVLGDNGKHMALIMKDGVVYKNTL